MIQKNKWYKGYLPKGQGLKRLFIEDIKGKKVKTQLGVFNIKDIHFK